MHRFSSVVLLEDKEIDTATLGTMRQLTATQKDELLTKHGDVMDPEPVLKHYINTDVFPFGSTPLPDCTSVEDSSERKWMCS